MKHYLLNHQPQKGLQAACAQQGQAPTCNARGKGHTSASPKTLTRILLVLLTMLLLPSAAWGQWDTKTFIFNGCNDNTILYASDSEGSTTSYTWFYQGASGIVNNEGKVEINVNAGSEVAKNTLKLANEHDYTIKQVTFNCLDISGASESSKIYVRALNPAPNGSDTIYYSNPYSFSNGTLSIDLDTKVGIPSKDLMFFIFSNDNEAFSFVLNSIEITKIADYNLSIGDVHLTGSNVNPETGAVTGMTGISFTPANAENKTPATLTLNGARITGAINCGSDITIDLKGTNTITSTDGPVIINSGSLTFKSTDGTGSLEMTPEASSTCISSPDNVVFLNNLMATELLSYKGTKTYIEKGYGVWIDENQLSAHHTLENSLSGGATITYDNEHHTLNLGSFTYGTSSLKSNIPELIVNLSGNNMLKSIYFEGTGDVTSGSLNIQSSNEGSTLTLCDEEEVYSVIHGFDDVTFGNDVMNYTFATGPTTYNKTSKELEYAIDNSPVYNTVLTFTSAETFEIWIGGTQVTSVFEETGITYDASGKLTLENALINGPIVSGLGDLTIHLKGTNNKIKQDEESGESLIASTNNGVLSFETDNETIGSLVFQNSAEEAFDGNPISGFTKVEYGAGLDYDADAQKIGLTDYPIYIGTTQVNSQNRTDILGNGKVTYDSENHIITLNDNAAITGPIKWGLPDDLTIALNGTSTITTTDGSAIMGTSSDSRGYLTIAKAEGASSSKLTMIGTGFPINDGFDNTSDESYAGEGLYWIALSSTTVEITDNPEYVIIEGYPMTDDRTISGRTGTTGTITYNSTDKILTIDNFEKEYETTGSGSISTGVVGLTVKLIGESSINAASANELFKAIRETATIEFVGVENGRLDITVGSTTGSPFKDFADGTITYDNLVLSGGGYGYSIAPPTAPEIKGVMYEGSPAVEITKNYVDGDIYYTIDYAGETEDVSKAKYTNRFTMAAPGIVTAWVEVNNATTDEVIGKYFGYIDTPYTIAKGSTKETTIYPLITEEDGFGISYSSQDESIATFANGIISGVATGSTQVIASLTPANDLEYTILNQLSMGVDQQSSSYILTMDVTVQELIDANTFTSGQNYGSFFNTTTESYKVPDGLVAYIITGVDGNSITIAETKILPPNAPVLLYRTNLENATNYTFIQATASDGTFPEGNILEYAYEAVSADASSELYVLYNGKFVKVTTGTDIAAKHCYLNLGEPVANTRGFYYIGSGEGTTAIQKVVLEKSTDGEWYTLQGQRVAKPAKGLYILNGKKVVVK